jgi:hypothetical protein
VIIGKIRYLLIQPESQMEKDQEHKVPSKETKVEKGKPLLMESELYQEVQKSDRMALVLHMLILGGIMH